MRIINYSIKKHSMNIKYPLENLIEPMRITYTDFEYNDFTIFDAWLSIYSETVMQLRKSK